MKFSKEFASYLAGFLDGDGSIYVKLTRNRTYRFGFQIAPYVVFYQSIRAKAFLEELSRLIGGGYVRTRKDGIAEYIIGDTITLQMVLCVVQPHVRLKQKQVALALEILEAKPKIKTRNDFIRVATMIDRFKDLNYSKKRTVTAQTVKEFLQKRQLTP